MKYPLKEKRLSYEKYNENAWHINETFTESALAQEWNS